MKFKYRIVQDANGDYKIQYIRKGFLSFLYDWNDKHVYLHIYNGELKTLDDFKSALDAIMEEDKKEYNKEIFKVVK